MRVFGSNFYRHSQQENEKRTIASVSAGGRNITLTNPLNYTHLGITVTLPDGTLFEARAEIGILTRNILIRGSDNVEWNNKIPACPDGFDTGSLSSLSVSPKMFIDTAKIFPVCKISPC